MRILVLSNMYPSAEKPFAGIFVKNQVEIMREEIDAASEVAVCAMPRRFTSRAGTVLKYAMFTFRSLPHLLRRYDILHIHYFVPLGLLGAIYRFLHPSSRLVVTFHGGDINDAHFRGMLGRFWRAISTAVDYAVAVGPGVAESIERHLAVRSLIVRPAGVDSRFFFPNPEPGSRRYDFVFAGSFSHRKGVDILIDVLSDARFQDVRLAFVGTGPLRGLIESLAETRAVEILDHLEQDELRKVYWQSKFLVLPSRSEPFGLVVSEAMFSGIPAVVSNVPGPRAQIADGETGFVFESEDAESLRSALLRALSLTEVQWTQMAASASRANQHYDIFTVTRDLLTEYERLSGRKRYA